MSDSLPRAVSRELQFEHGRAIGISNRWEKGQYCSILTPAGIVGCGIYDLKTPAEFNQAIAIAKGTPACPLVEPEDLFDARIVGVTPQAAAYGIRVGITGREAVELLLEASQHSAEAKAPPSKPAPLSGVRVRSIDHVTLVVQDLERSRNFYVQTLGMREVPRPGFSFPGLWFQAGHTQIHLNLEAADSGPAGNLLPEHLRSIRTHHVAFEVEDAAAAGLQLERRSVPILCKPQQRPDGYTQVFVTDPDGHIIELCSAPRNEPAAP
jgi:glyoxylase I family protein